jgi:hypothetical protein
VKMTAFCAKFLPRICVCLVNIDQSEKEADVPDFSGRIYVPELLGTESRQTVATAELASLGHRREYS